MDKIDSTTEEKPSTTKERSDFADDGKDSAPSASAEKENTSQKADEEQAAEEEPKETPEQQLNRQIILSPEMQQTISKLNLNFN